MWLKNKKIDILNRTIERLNNILKEGNYIELTYLLREQKRNYKKKFASWDF